MDTPDLVAHLPVPMSQFYHYLKTVGYEDEPDYDYLMSLMDDLFVLSGKPESVPFDWEKSTTPLPSPMDQDKEPGMEDDETWSQSQVKSKSPTHSSDYKLQPKFDHLI